MCPSVYPSVPERVSEEKRLNVEWDNTPTKRGRQLVLKTVSSCHLSQPNNFFIIGISTTSPWLSRTMGWYVVITSVHCIVVSWFNWSISSSISAMVSRKSVSLGWSLKRYFRTSKNAALWISVWILPSSVTQQTERQYVYGINNDMKWIISNLLATVCAANICWRGTEPHWITNGWHTHTKNISTYMEICFFWYNHCNRNTKKKLFVFVLWYKNNNIVTNTLKWLRKVYA